MAGARWTVAILGAGVVGTSLGRALKARGHEIAGVVTRSEGTARQAAARLGGAPVFADAAEAALRADLVLVTTPDRSVAQVCAAVARQDGFRAGAVVLHTSGALDSTALEPARGAGCAVGSWHPLQTFASAEAATFEGVYFFFEGMARAGEVATALTRELGGFPVALAPGGKALYHAAAVTACNYFVTLVHEGVELMAASGVPRDVALPALLPLLRGTVRNLEAVGLPQALTGPIARGDVPTVARHLEAIRRGRPEAEALYRALGRRTVPVGREKGTLPAPVAEELDRLLGS